MADEVWLFRVFWADQVEHVNSNLKLHGKAGCDKYNNNVLFMLRPISSCEMKEKRNEDLVLVAKGLLDMYEIILVD